MIGYKLNEFLELLGEPGRDLTLYTRVSKDHCQLGDLMVGADGVEEPLEGWPLNLIGEEVVDATFAVIEGAERHLEHYGYMSMKEYDDGQTFVVYDNGDIDGIIEKLNRCKTK